MNAEALNGMVLGTCTLQKLIGRGGMGAVFLAQQSRPRRQVAVKLLLPMTGLQPRQRAAFLERFRRETDAAASLEHPNILPVHEYGERDGLAYLVMPYISGGTLRDELDREGQLPLSRVVNYLDQMAAALDFAHEHGVIHRDIKPANILMAPEKRLLLTDFGLVKIITDEHSKQKPLSEIGMPLGTPDYMAPEQVVGGEIDGRADLYALGVILYQMLTGTVPFKGEMPMKVALQHMHTPPPALRPLRPELSASTEQVVLRALAKRPTDRYIHARDLVSAFRLTLDATGVQVGNTPQTSSTPTNEGPATSARRRSLFDPVWRATEPASTEIQETSPLGKTAAALDPASSLQLSNNKKRNDIVGKTSMEMPSFSGLLTDANIPIPTQQHMPFTPTAAQIAPSPASRTANQPAGLDPTSAGSSSSTKLRLGHKTSLKGLQQGNATSNTTQTKNTASLNNQLAPTMGLAEESTGPIAITGQKASSTRQLDPFAPSANNAQSPAATRQLEPLAPAPTTGMLPYSGLQPGVTGALQVPTGEYNGETGMLKLAQPVKVVKVPIAGQPGQYMTGILPMLPPTPQPEPLAFKARVAALPGTVKKNKKKSILLAAVFVILVGSLTLLTHTPAGKAIIQPKPLTTKADLAATAAVHASATAQANVILFDSLATNGSDWPIQSTDSQTAVFENGSYHITVKDKATNIADALLPDYTTPDTFVYTLTMSEIKGDDNNTTNDNVYGMIFHYNTTQQDGNNISTFYCVRILHSNKGAQYQFVKYFDDPADKAQPHKWDIRWSKNVGNEYHPGQGDANKNTITVAADGANYTIFNNNQKIDTIQNGDLKGGQIGMMVNLPGTEVAFSNLKLTLK